MSGHSNVFILGRPQMVSLIDRYHAATRESRARWYASRAALSEKVHDVVTEAATLLREADPATRLIARRKLTELVDSISSTVRTPENLPLMDVFGWSHFSDMNLYGDDAKNRTNARSFAIVIENLADHRSTREEARLLLIRLYGSDITHIGPGLTGLMYFLQPGLFPILGHKALNGFRALTGRSTRAGKEGLKQLADHLPLIWELVDRYGDVLDSGDMADVSGFLYWLGAADRMGGSVQERPPTYEPEDLEDTPLSLSREQLQAGIREISIRLALDPHTIEQAAFNLLTGKSLILTGPPGTGKTELARLIPQVFWHIYPMVVTATTEWTSYEVIGGLFPEVVQGEDSSDHFRFIIRQGCVYEAVLRNWKIDDHLSIQPRRSRYNPSGSMDHFEGVWLIIDEFNRADIDRAFGDLFTSLESGQLRVPAIESSGGSSSSREIPIPLHFRIIGTLNTFDRHHLFEMSDALKRRFAFVEVLPHPDLVVEESLVLDRAAGALRQQGLLVDRTELQALSRELFEWIRFVRLFRMIGTAQLISVLSYTGLCRSYEKDGITALGEGLCAHILPQLEGLAPEQLQLIALFSEGSYETLFSALEARIMTHMPSRFDLRDLQRVAEYLSQISTGPQKETALQIVEAAGDGGTESLDRLEELLGGSTTRAGWRDIYSEMSAGQVFPAVVRTLREMMDERT